MSAALSTRTSGQRLEYNHIPVMLSVCEEEKVWKHVQCAAVGIACHDAA